MGFLTNSMDQACFLIIQVKTKTVSTVQLNTLILFKDVSIVLMIESTQIINSDIDSS